MKLSPFGIALVGVISYLTYHAIAGKQGLSEWSAMQEQVSQLKDERDSRVKYKVDLQDRIARLYPESLDKDFLEELARTRFHFVYSDEVLLEPPTLTAQLPENEELLELSKY